VFSHNATQGRSHDQRFDKANSNQRDAMKPLTNIRRRLSSRLARYAAPTEPTRQLPEPLSRPVHMRVDEASSKPPTGDLYQIWQQIPGGHKWWHYFPVYESVLGHLRERPIRFLEIGVYQGGSLAMWRRYLHADSMIVGLDIDPNCARFDDPSMHTHVRIGDQSDAVFLRRVVEEFGPFDVIIDDGSHINSHMIRSFGELFGAGLVAQGIYIAEDTHANFWNEYRDQAYSFVDLCKDLVDLAHAHYLDLKGPQPFRVGNPNRAQQAEVTTIGQQVKEIRFLDSMIVIYRDAERLLPTSEHL